MVWLKLKTEEAILTKLEKKSTKETRHQEANKLQKGVWGMPRLSEAKKDVTSCEKLRGLAHTS